MPLLLCCSSPAFPSSSAAAASSSPPLMSDSSAKHRREKPLVDKAVIIGGGLGGLAAALQLRRIGVDAQVYEKNPTISGGEGTLISLFPNGCKALNIASPDVVQKMRSAGALNNPSRLVLPDGTKFGEWSLSTQMEEKYGQPLIAILWKNALKILSEALPDDCKHMGYECFDVTEEEDGAVAHFKKENESVSVQALGIGTHASLFNGRTVFIINGVHGKLYWALSVEDDCCEGSTKVRSKTQEEAKERLLGYFEGFSLATAVIQATDPDLILERRVLDLPVLSTWFQGNTVLLGDAVHAVTPALGQGANLAFEDGAQLANFLMTSSDLRSALEEYQALQMPRARQVSKQSQVREGQRGDSFYDWLYNPCL